MKKDITCISCPLGCQMVVEETNGEYTVTGNSCKNGIKYGIEEMTDPRRILPTTIVIRGALHPRLPVTTSDAIPKGKIFDAMAVINQVVVDAPVRLGDVVVKNLLGTGIDVVATKSMHKI